jgi:hypothetical protein
MPMNDCKTTRSVEIMGTVANENDVYERFDAEGNRWYKAYVGGGEHFKNWLEQARELGEVQVEEIPPGQYQCYRESGEAMFRIWVKEKKTGDTQVSGNNDR